MRVAIRCVSVNRAFPPARLGEVAKWSYGKQTEVPAAICPDLNLAVATRSATTSTKAKKRRSTFETKEKPTADKPKDFMSVYQVGLRPSRTQRQQLNRQIECSQMTHDWTLWLVGEKRVGLNALSWKPDQRLLHKIVVCADMSKIDAAHLAFFSPLERTRLFDSTKVSTGVKLCALKAFIETYQTSKPERTRPNRYSSGNTGTFGVQKKQVRVVDPVKDVQLVPSVVVRNSLCIIPDTLSASSTKKNNRDRYITIAKPVATLPPFDHDITITKRANGKFVLNIPCSVDYTRRRKKTTEDNTSSTGPVVSIDPGVRTFANLFDATNHTFTQLGTKQQRDRYLDKFAKKIGAIDADIQRARNTSSTQRVDDLQRRSRKVRYKLRNAVTDLHARLASDLVSTCSKVVIGDYHLRKKRVNDPVHENTRRWAAIWGHGRFRERLKHRARGTDCSVIVQDERYTSVTCCSCGKRHLELGGKELYTCDFCGLAIHRDLNGCINILNKSNGRFVSIE